MKFKFAIFGKYSWWVNKGFFFGTVSNSLNAPPSSLRSH